ncbi:MAG: hypothetical protein M1836_001940 [Candelina mexicana]|nr:MAG: hypothetical protein M1836_001940 [Candelina mexicana]
MDPLYRFPASPGTPLFPVSPERANQQRQPQYDLPNSPSLPDFHSLKTLKASSDVQGKVAQFNSLSKEAIERRKAHDAALKRAVLGREEAEGETRRIREDVRSLRKEVLEGQDRERRVGERLEAVMDELHRSKELHRRSQTLYEKEARRARKEAFKSSSALVELQEELKAARESLRITQSELELQKVKVGKREQEAFTAQYQLVGVQEELAKVRELVKVVEEERDALKTSLKEEEVARIAAEGRIALPVPKDDDEFPSPRKPRASAVKILELAVETIDKEQDELVGLQNELRREKRRREHADDQVSFMKMECQFRCCSCRIAERQGADYVHDDRLVEAITSKSVEMPRLNGSVPPRTPRRQPSEKRLASTEATAHAVPDKLFVTEPNEAEPLINFSPTTGTFKAIIPPSQYEHFGPSETNHLFDDIFSDARPQLEHTVSAPHFGTISSFSGIQTSTMTGDPCEVISVPPTSPRHTTITTTTTIPLADVFSPRTMSREEALEQIRQRRGRARSIAAGSATPRKQMLEGITRRDISAPSIKYYNGAKKEGDAK